MSKRATVLALLASSLTLPLAAHAHHSFAAEFDATKVVHLEGTVVQFAWVNPHSWIYMDVKKPDGTVEKWMIEGGTPNAMFRRGFTKDSLAVGTAIVVDGYQARDHTLKRANGRNITYPDGRKLFLASSAPDAEDKDLEKKK